MEKINYIESVFKSNLSIYGNNDIDFMGFFKFSLFDLNIFFFGMLLLDVIVSSNILLFIWGVLKLEEKGMMSNLCYFFKNGYVRVK